MKEFIQFWKDLYNMLHVIFFGNDWPKTMPDNITMQVQKKPKKPHLTPEQAKAVAARYIELKQQNLPNKKIAEMLNKEFSIERTAATYHNIAKQHGKTE